MKSTTRENLLLYISRDYKYHQEKNLFTSIQLLNGHFKETKVLRFPGKKLQTGEI